MMMQWKLLLPYWPGREALFFIKTSKNKTVLHNGVGNRCADGRYVVFLDYDNSPLDWVHEEATLLQRTFDTLGTAYIFQTKHGYHTVFLEKHSLGEIVRIMDVTTCDKHYKDIPLYYGRKTWVLRATDKKDETITHVATIPGYPLDRRRVSKPHTAFLKERFGIKTLHADYLEDNETDLLVTAYRVSKENG